MIVEKKNNSEIVHQFKQSDVQRQQSHLVDKTFECILKASDLIKFSPSQNPN